MTESHSRPESPSFLGHMVGKRGALATRRLQIKPSGSGEENGRIMSENPGVYIAMKSAKKSNEWVLYNASHGRLVCVYF